MTVDEMNKALEAVYLEWLNNYLTVEKFAEHLGISVALAEKLIVILGQVHREHYENMSEM